MVRYLIGIVLLVPSGTLSAPQTITAQEQEGIAPHHLDVTVLFVSVVIEMGFVS